MQPLTIDGYKLNSSDKSLTKVGSQDGWFVLNNSPLPPIFTKLRIPAYSCDLKEVVIKDRGSIGEYSFALMEEVAARLMMYSRILSPRVDAIDQNEYLIGVSLDRLTQDIADNISGHQSWLEQTIGLKGTPHTLFSENRSEFKSKSELLMMTLKKLSAEQLISKPCEDMIFAPTTKLINSLAFATD